jgi:hypothetical protein
MGGTVQLPGHWAPQESFGGISIAKIIPDGRDQSNRAIKSRSCLGSYRICSDAATIGISRVGLWMFIWYADYLLKVLNL